MAAENARNEDVAVCRNMGAAVLAAIGLAVLLSVGPPAGDEPDPVTATHGHSVDSGFGW